MTDVNDETQCLKCDGYHPDELVIFNLKMMRSLVKHLGIQYGEPSPAAVLSACPFLGVLGLSKVQLATALAFNNSL
eukprot:2938387-Amphidinium_carterae.1